METLDLSNELDFTTLKNMRDCDDFYSMTRVIEIVFELDPLDPVLVEARRLLALRRETLSQAGN